VRAARRRPGAARHRARAESGIAYTVPFGSLVGAPMLQSCSETYSPAFTALGVTFGVAELAAVVLFAIGVAARPSDGVALRGDRVTIAF
jgi:hypothetical protein